MAIQMFNSENVLSAADKLQTINNNINRDFESLQKSLKSLESNWKSPAGTVAHTLMYEILKGNETRSNVIDNYTRVLTQYVSQGYIIAEENSTKLADLFK